MTCSRAGLVRVSRDLQGRVGQGLLCEVGKA